MKRCVSIVLYGFAYVVSAASAELKQTAIIKASNAKANDHFGNGGTLEGHGVALSGDGNTMAVGAPYESSGAYSEGAVYVFIRNNNAWSQQALLKPSNPGQGNKFGHVVALSQDGNTLAVSAYFEASAAKGIDGDQKDRSIPQAGAVYVFARTGATWKQQAYVKASNTGEAGSGDQLGDGDQFGFSISLSADGNTLASGAIGEDSGATGINGDQNDNSQQGAGAVYVYTRSGGKWAQQAYIKPSNTDANDLFGYSVALSANGDTLAASSYDEDGSSRQTDGPMDKNRRGSGAIYVFTRSPQGWAQTAYLKASNAEAGDSLGYAIAISQDGNTIAGGAGDEDCLSPGINPPGCDDDVKTDTSAGAVYVFVRNGGKWTQQAFIKSSHPGKEDWFGSRLTLSGDGNTLAVGAQLENGASSGINGKQDDLTAEDAGALYFFVRTGTAWAQTAYVKASNAKAFSEFGSAMALSRDGRLMAVGARGESSAAPGAGAVYVFAVQ